MEIFSTLFIFVKNRFNGAAVKFTPLSKIDCEKIEFCMFPRIISTAQIRETETVNGRSRPLTASQWRDIDPDNILTRFSERIERFAK